MFAHHCSRPNSCTPQDHWLITYPLSAHQQETCSPNPKPKHAVSSYLSPLVHNLPRFSLLVPLPHTASTCLGWRLEHWWLHPLAKYRDVSLHWDPTTWHCHPKYIPITHTHTARTTQPTFPPEAQREPSGETVTQFKKPLCPKWLVFNLQFVKFQTYNNKNFTRPSISIILCLYVPWQACPNHKTLSLGSASLGKTSHNSPSRYGSHPIPQTMYNQLTPDTIGYTYLDGVLAHTEGIP